VNERTKAGEAAKKEIDASSADLSKILRHKGRDSLDVFGGQIAPTSSWAPFPLTLADPLWTDYGVRKCPLGLVLGARWLDILLVARYPATYIRLHSIITWPDNFRRNHHRCMDGPAALVSRA
jgi:hypothetical protein